MPLQSDSSASEMKILSAMREFVKEYGEKLSGENIHISTILVNKQRNFMDEFKDVATSMKSVYKNSIKTLKIFRRSVVFWYYGDMNMYALVFFGYRTCGLWKIKTLASLKRRFIKSREVL